MLKDKVIDSYLECHKLRSFYTEGSYHNWFLGFDLEWYQSTLSDMDYLQIELLDKRNQKTFHIKYTHICIDDNLDYLFLDYNYNERWLAILNRYVYEDHFCDCHRKSAIHDIDPSFNDDTCENDISIIKITPSNSELILYSEIINENKLNNILESHK